MERGICDRARPRTWMKDAFRMAVHRRGSGDGVASDEIRGARRLRGCRSTAKAFGVRCTVRVPRHRHALSESNRNGGKRSCRDGLTSISTVLPNSYRVLMTDGSRRRRLIAR